ncbi:hypothetical protein, partial [Klebsiella quasivariicola]|uniref:hypothetical protein n=1 Tax=Klebsiella quasivariicola TaxID=2026240 RepID=UPI001CC2E30A
VGDLGYSAIDQIAQFGLSSLKVIYYSEQLFRSSIERNTLQRAKSYFYQNAHNLARIRIWIVIW